MIYTYIKLTSNRSCTWLEYMKRNILYRIWTINKRTDFITATSEILFVGKELTHILNCNYIVKENINKKTPKLEDSICSPPITSNTVLRTPLTNGPFKYIHRFWFSQIFTSKLVDWLFKSTIFNIFLFKTTKVWITRKLVAAQFWLKTSQKLRMLSSVTLNCQVTKIVMNSGPQLSEL